MNQQAAAARFCIRDVMGLALFVAIILCATSGRQEVTTPLYLILTGAWLAEYAIRWFRKPDRRPLKDLQTTAFLMFWFLLGGLCLTAIAATILLR